MSDFERVVVVIVCFVMVFCMVGAVNTERNQAVGVLTEKEWIEDAINTDARGYAAHYMIEEAEMLAKITWIEAGAVPTEFEKRCVMWVVINRVDLGRCQTIQESITAPGAFAWDPSVEVREDLYEMALDVLAMWLLGEREIPVEYQYFYGDGVHNYFYTDFDNPIPVLFVESLMENKNERN